MNTTEYRNLTEQVLKNKEDILHHFQRDEVLADFGIHIIGQVQTPEELPASAANYGDAYAVGTQSPFNYYIWTRANNLSPVDYWFAFGEIAIAGPQGPVGPQGIPGRDGKTNKWYYFTGDYLPAGENNGDLAIDDRGNIYRLVNPTSDWAYVMNIKGPQGAQGPKGDTGPRGAQGPTGPKGEQGDVGGFINIAGIVENEYALPDPDLIDNLTVAYLVGSVSPYNLYIQVGSTSATAQWFNAGPLNVATMVTSGGIFLNTFDADTKVNKVWETGLTRVYGILPDGLQTVFNVSYTPNEGYIAQYGTQGKLYTNTPTEASHCANKAYVDSKVSSSSSSGSVVILNPSLQTLSQEALLAVKKVAEHYYANELLTKEYIFALRPSLTAKLLYPVEYTAYKRTNGMFISLQYLMADTDKGSLKVQITVNADGGITDYSIVRTRIADNYLPTELRNPLKFNMIDKMPTSSGFIDTSEYSALIAMVDALKQPGPVEADGTGLPAPGLYFYNGNIFTTQNVEYTDTLGYNEKITVGYYDPITKTGYFWKINHTWGTYTLEAYQGPTTILFYIDDVDYNAIEGQTWGEWVNSSYNTLGLTAGTQLGDDPTHIYYAGYTPLTLYGSPVSTTDPIYDGSYYNTAI